MKNRRARDGDPSPRRRTGRLSIGAVFLLLVGALGALALSLSDRPDLTAPGGASTAVLDRDGRLLRLHLAPDQRYRLPVDLADIAPDMVQATLLYEDRHFRRHFGVNPVALVRAAWQTWVSGERPIGASTITMQVARLHYGLNTRSVRGKLVQMARALQLEWHYSKDDILAAYLNAAPYGGNVEGVGAAARVYFDKTAAELSLGEALALAVVPQNPVARRPGANMPAALAAARERLTQRWQRRFGLPPEVLARARLPLSVRTPTALPFHAPHAAQSAVRAGEQRLTLDSATQRVVEDAVARYLARAARQGLDNAAVIVVDHRSMDVLASVGSAGFFDAAIQGQVDGTRAKRSPGSTLKPLLYAQAMDAGLIHPMSMLKDAPTRYAAYAPENFDRGFMGPVTATDALNLSRNVPAIDLLQRVGHVSFNNLLKRGGVRDLRDADHYGLAMILGGNELTLRELAGLYAALANDGRWRPLRTRLDDAPVRPVPLVSPEAAFLVLDMLRQHARPDGISSGASVAWKTGTSYGFRDAWTMGVAGPYVVGVWVGHFDGHSDPALIGREAAAPLFFELIDSLGVRGARPTPAPQLNVRRVEVCAPTGDLASVHCPRAASSWFIPGVSPIATSRVHRAVRVNAKTGRRACGTTTGTVAAIYEYWPSDMRKALARAGVALRSPPAWSDTCAVGALAAHGIAPEIRTPVAHLRYQVRPGSADQMALSAVAEADTSELFWFVNGALLARTRPDEPALWTPRAGRHEVAVVDDLGRSSRREVEVTIAPVIEGAFPLLR